MHPEHDDRRGGVRCRVRGSLKLPAEMRNRRVGSCILRWESDCGTVWPRVRVRSRVTARSVPSPAFGVGWDGDPVGRPAFGVR